MIDGQPENLAVGLVSGHDVRMEQRKATPFSDELRMHPPTKDGIAHRERPHLHVFQADRFRVAIAICKDLLDGRVAATLDRMAVNLLLVPALSAKTDPFRSAASARVAAAQAVTIVVNGPLRGTDDRYVDPAIVIGQPVEGRTSVGLAAAGPAPSLTLIPIPASPMTSL